MKEKCKQCNKEFEKKTDWQRFCSDKCRILYHNTKAKEVVCPKCGHEFKKG